MIEYQLKTSRQEEVKILFGPILKMKYVTDQIQDLRNKTSYKKGTHIRSETRVEDIHFLHRYQSCDGLQN